MTNSQLSFDLPIVVSRAADDFLVSASNQAAVKLIDAWPQWPGNMAIIVGPKASGKSHLAAIWRERAEARTLPPDTPAKQAIDHGGHILVDDADRWDQAENLLHVVNAIREAGHTLLLTGIEAPGNWPCAGLADLKSRLVAAQSVAIEDPDEALLSAALAKNFADRQIQLDDRVIDYLLSRMPRTFAAARDIAGRMDRLSLSEGRRITIPLARKVLENLA